MAFLMSGRLLMIRLQHDKFLRERSVHIRELIQTEQHLAQIHQCSFAIRTIHEFH